MKYLRWRLYKALKISHSMPNSKKYIINNVYRLPKYEVEDYSTFTEEFESIIVYLNTLKQVLFICPPSATYNIHSNGNINDKDKSGIFVNDISDHKLIFSIFFFFRKKLPIVVVRDVCPSVCPSVEIISFRGISISNGPIDLKMSMNVRKEVMHVRKT